MCARQVCAGGQAACARGHLRGEGGFTQRAAPGYAWRFMAATTQLRALKHGSNMEVTLTLWPLSSK